MNTDYYEKNAQKYFDKTLSLDVAGVRDRFLQYIPPCGSILDAGSGSGRDTLAFMKLGFDVDAFDFSPAMAMLSSRHTGKRTHVVSFQAYEPNKQFNGIWACASLLHVPRQSLPPVLARLCQATKSGGAIYASFKYGTADRVDADGRGYTDMDMEGVLQLFGNVKELDLRELWKYGGLPSQPLPETWMNVIAVKTE